MGDIVATVASPGHDIGIVTLTGELVHPNEEKEPTLSNEIPKIYRKASKDIDISTARDKEEPMKVRTRTGDCSKLEMKIRISNFKEMDLRLLLLHANDRIDFRALIKDFAKEFSTVLR
jgi:cell fate regulator YaaT (PSP1 superfamily)